jgi:hypothetical protein
MPGTRGTSDKFGSSLAMADGLLAIGCPSDNDSPARSGSVTAICRSIGQFKVSLITQQMLPGTAPTSSDQFGKALAIADFGRPASGFPFTCLDIAIGAPGAKKRTSTGDVPGGSVFVVYGLAAIGTFDLANYQQWAQGTNGLSETGEIGDAFGRCLAAGRFNGGSEADLAIGNPWETMTTVSAGYVMVMYGQSSTGLSAWGHQIWHQDVSFVDDQAEKGDVFGSALGGR